MDYYELLGIPRTADADQVKNAYRKLAMAHHPDRKGDPELFKKIIDAYRTLSDDSKRSEYNRKNPPRIIRPGKNPKRKPVVRRDPSPIIDVEVGNVDVWSQMKYDEDGTYDWIGSQMWKDSEKKEEPPKPAPKGRPVERETVRDISGDPNLGSHTIKEAPPPKYDIWGQPIRKTENENGWTDVFAQQYASVDTPNIR